MSSLSIPVRARLVAPEQAKALDARRQEVIQRTPMGKLLIDVPVSRLHAHKVARSK